MSEAGVCDNVLLDCITMLVFVYDYEILETPLGMMQCNTTQRQNIQLNLINNQSCILNKYNFKSAHCYYCIVLHNIIQVLLLFSSHCVCRSWILFNLLWSHLFEKIVPTHVSTVQSICRSNLRCLLTVDRCTAFRKEA